MLVIFEKDYGIKFDNKNSQISAGKPRLLIRKLGEIALGDDWIGKLSVDGSNLIIIDEDSKRDRVVSIDIPH
jgi:hypothetical protein